ncbi:MAG: phospho-sugar mutase, partial [Mycobacteriales bacterium]
LSDVPRSTSYAVVDDSIEQAYVDRVGRLARGDERDLRVAYTPLHGVGGAVLAAAFAAAGFPQPITVPEQAAPDPDFPTVSFPNPEEPGALDLVRALARKRRTDLVIANDPDADRCAVAVGDLLLTGDELGVLIADHLMRTGNGSGPSTGHFATTIVSSSMLGTMCAARGVPYAETLTGFKWIVRAGADLAYGYEEAIGYCVAPSLVRDKDGISTAVVIADLAATLKSRGRTLLDRLGELQREFGVHATGQLAIRVEDVAEIDATMRRLRAGPPASLAGRAVTCADLLPQTDGLRFTGDAVRVVVRPSGTEPKLKCYLQVVVPAGRDLDEARHQAAGRLATLHSDMAASLGQTPAP